MIMTGPSRVEVSHAMSMVISMPRNPFIKKLEWTSMVQGYSLGTWVSIGVLKKKWLIRHGYCMVIRPGIPAYETCGEAKGLEN